VQWLLGSVATGIAVLAVAFVGFGLLGGRLNWRTGARVVMGVFILFGAPMIAQELMSLARDGDASTVGASRDNTNPAFATGTSQCAGL
jgi:type IV secretion system protein VirB2